VSAFAPMTEAEKSAKAWAESQELTPDQIVGAVTALRSDLGEVAPRRNEAHAEWRRLNDQAEQIMCRIEALKLRLATEL
jgi:hypothetical protein